jgi:hypothetical protein
LCVLPGKQPGDAALSKSVPLFAPYRVLPVSAELLTLMAMFPLPSALLQIVVHA